MPLMEKVNTKTPSEILKNRTLEMAKLPNYECIGLYNDGNLIGICGLWYSVRHYIGKSVEPDHVIIDDTERSKGLGKTFFKWIDNYVKSKGCEAIELNTYVTNQKSHKFYMNDGYNIYAYHFVKVLRDDKEFY